MEKPVDTRPGEPEGVEYKRRALATIFGAPISWVALFGALIGVTSLVPMIFYPFGGGYLSVGMVIFGPIAGLVLGPWAGFVAGLIGGLIGMFISPASFPMGLLDVLLSGACIPLFFGLANLKYKKIFIPLWIVMIPIVIIFPYHIPGAAGGFSTASEPGYLLSWSWTYVGLVLYLVLGLRFLPRWLAPGASTRLTFAGLLIYYFAGYTTWMLPWKIIYFAAIKFPWDMVQADNTITWSYTLLMLVAGTVIGQVTMTAMRRGGLQRVDAGMV